MPRQARLDAPGTLHHVMVRGIEKRKIVDDGRDRQAFVGRLGEVAGSTGTAIYAWSLMKNHAHILLRSGPAGLPRFMRRLLTGYAMDYNRRHRRHGHLFQNRYKSIVCEEDPYFRELVRYIHLNPLRAGLVKELKELDRYRWCGHSVLMGRVKYEWQDRSFVLGWFGQRERKAVAEYREYMQQGVSLGRRPELVRGGLVRSLGGWSAVKSRRQKRERVIADERVPGDGEFVARVLEEAEERIRRQLPSERRAHEAMKLIETVCKDVEVSREELISGSRRGPVAQARSLLARRLVRELGIPQAEAARLLGVTTPAVAKALKRTGSE